LIMRVATSTIWRLCAETITPTDVFGNMSRLKGWIGQLPESRDRPRGSRNCNRNCPDSAMAVRARTIHETDTSLIVLTESVAHTSRTSAESQWWPNNTNLSSKYGPNLSCTVSPCQLKRADCVADAALSALPYFLYSPFARVPVSPFQRIVAPRRFAILPSVASSCCCCAVSLYTRVGGVLFRCLTFHRTPASLFRPSIASPHRAVSPLRRFAICPFRTCRNFATCTTDLLPLSPCRCFAVPPLRCFAASPFRRFAIATSYGFPV